MTAHNCLYIVVFFAATLSFGSWVFAEGNVTVISISPSTPAKVTSTTSDGTPVVHKSLHKKKKTAVVAATPPASAPPAPAIIAPPAPPPPKPAAVTVTPVVVDP